MSKGHSLLEVLVSLSLLSVLLTVLVQLFIQGTRSTRGIDREAELGGLAQAALTRVTRDLEGAAVESLDLADGATFLAGEPWMVQPDGTGLEWRRYVLYWVDGDRLLRSELPLATPLTAPEPLADPASHRGEARLVARGTRSFRVEASPDDPRALTVRLSLSRRWGSQDYAFELVSGLRVRN